MNHHDEPATAMTPESSELRAAIIDRMPLDLLTAALLGFGAVGTFVGWYVAFHVAKVDIALWLGFGTIGSGYGVMTALTFHPAHSRQAADVHLWVGLASLSLMTYEAVSDVPLWTTAPIVAGSLALMAAGWRLHVAAIALRAPLLERYLAAQQLAETQRMDKAAGR